MVTVPPRIAVNPIGINRRDIGNPERAEILLTTGRNSAAAPTFCMNEDMMPTVADIIGIIRASVLPPTFRINPATLLITPVLSRPAPIIITAIIDMTALLEKPLNKFSVGTRPCSRPIIGANKELSPSNTRIEMAASSTLTTSNENR